MGSEIEQKLVSYEGAGVCRHALDPLHSEFDGSASDRFPVEISYLPHQATCQNLCAEELVGRLPWKLV